MAHYGKAKPNQYIIKEDHTEIVITTRNGVCHIARIDSDDQAKLEPYQFYVRKLGRNFYAYCEVKNHTHYLHRMVFPCSIWLEDTNEKMLIHHIKSGPDASIDTLDCRKAHLRHLRSSEHLKFHREQYRLECKQLKELRLAA